jgi:signal transduction histidine kinase/CheY-like chemotaxis protein
MSTPEPSFKPQPVDPCQGSKADESALLIREKLVRAREDAVKLREIAADLHEDLDRLPTRVAKSLQAASDDNLLMLQQVNARLVVASIEAHELTEQVETAKVHLEHAKWAAEKANLAKSDFLSCMSHELRTPLNTILGFAQLMASSSPPPTPIQQGRIEKILQAGWYLLVLIDEILDLAAIESGKLSLSQQPVRLMQVMRESQAMIESQAEHRGIALSFLPFDTSWHVKADPTRLKQVLINLLSNAIKYNRAHGTVEVKCMASTSHRIRISITDSGAGLPGEMLAQLFQPFNRLGQETGTEEGTGIGLVLTRRLVELMGGTMGVQSTLGIGSEFWFELMHDAESAPPASIATSAQPTPQVHEKAAQCTLLYVEDNPANLMLVEQIIEGYPHIKMLSAKDADCGLALARAHVPDVILMDISLPGISGIKALHLLRAEPSISHIPVLALSANAMPHDIESGMAAGFLRYLAKPIKVDQLMASLDLALQVSTIANRQRN